MYVVPMAETVTDSSLFWSCDGDQNKMYEMVFEAG
jgi:hypothetical protein